MTLRLDYRTLIEPVTEQALRDPDCASVVLIGEDAFEETTIGILPVVDSRR